jgi:RHS repeat-associated protein
MQGSGGVGGLLAVTLNDSWYFPLTDANGNITAYIDESGSVVAEYAYDAFGLTISQSGTMSDAFAFRFSTKYFDTETGLYYYGRRFYSPELHRWLNRDPIDEDGGVNLYAFCENNAVNGVDVLGQWILYFDAGFSDQEILKISKIFKDLGLNTQLALNRAEKWQKTVDSLPECCVIKDKLKLEMKKLLEILRGVSDGLNSSKLLTLRTKDVEEADAESVFNIWGRSKNIVNISVNSNSSMVNEIWDELSNSLFHELTHIAGLMDERRWKSGKNLNFENAHRYIHVSSNPTGFGIPSAVNYWATILRVQVSPPYSEWAIPHDNISEGGKNE